MSYGQRKCSNDELLSYFQVEAPIHRPSFFLFFSLTIKDKTKISLTIKILHLGQGSFTRKVRTIFTLKIIVSIFVKLFLILVLHLRQFFIVRIFVKRAAGLTVITILSMSYLFVFKSKRPGLTVNLCLSQRDLILQLICV